MSQRSHLTDSEAWTVVGRLEGATQSQAEVAQAIGVSQSVISRIWNRFLETRIADRRPGQGRRWATMPNEDRYLVLTARIHQNMNATLLQQHLRSATGTTVSTQTVQIRLHGVSMYARRPIVCVRLLSRHRRDHREWATEHVNWSGGFPFEEGIVRIEWSVCSTDMNPIEHVWDALGRRVAGLQPPPTKSPRTGKSSSGRVGQNTPTRD
ncbi:transposable element Tcb2 transposase [Trichonephila clavipes]|nr:transposable element Tcb2 transposase [Trichonephila clavipes]